MVASGEDLDDPVAFCRIFGAYRDKAIRKPEMKPLPGFYEDANAENIVSGDHSRLPDGKKVNPDTKLVGIFPAHALGGNNLQRLRKEIRQISASYSLKESKDRSMRREPLDWICGVFETDGGTPELPKLKRVIEKYMLGHYEDKKKQCEPQWCTKKETFAKHLDRSPEEWLALLGMMPRSGKNWVLVFGYRAGDTLGLACPSILEAGDYSPHVVTPPGRPREEGGVTLSLPDCHEEDGQPELIHAEFRDKHCFKADFLLKVGTYDGSSPKFDDAKVVELRERFLAKNHR